MSRKFMECSIAAFFIIASICVLVGLRTFQQFSSQYLALVRVQAEARTEMLNAAGAMREAFVHAGYLAAARGLQAADVLADDEADRIAAESIEALGDFSEELETFAAAIDRAHAESTRGSLPGE